MPLAPHLVRRGAVYYWRRRLPRHLVSCWDRRHVFLSLTTSNPRRARSLAVQLDAAFEEIVVTVHSSLLNPGQLDAILRSVLAAHATKLDRVAAIEKTTPDFDPEEATRLEQCMGWAYRLLAAQGVGARVRVKDHEAMTAAGLDQADIATVARHLDDLRRNRMVPTPPPRLEHLVASQGAPPSTMNLASAQQVYFRAMSLALFETARRYSGEAPDAGEIVAAALRIDRSASTSLPPAVSAPVAPEEPPPPPLPESPPVEDGIIAIGERLIAAKAQDEDWDKDTQDQARQTFSLFLRFLSEEHKVEGLLALRQSHVAPFVTFLRTGIYRFYGKSSRDRTRTIAELRKIAAANDPKLQGLAGGTLNRHMGNLAKLLQYARAQGVRIDPEIDVVTLRAKKKSRGRARDQRPKMTLAVTQRVFHAPAFVGCAAWDRPDEEGGEVYHRALYFVPMLLEYSGARREEICGLAVDDVMLDDPIPHIRIRRNAFRRIKNPQSDREIPLHPEALRLGFSEYVVAIRALGYQRVFPDLVSPSSKSPAGDRFYDDFMPVVSWACEVEKAELKFVLHSIRHGFNTRLKHAGVPEEERADLMGHGGDSETTERYADPIRLQRAVEILQKLPVVTAHLQPQPLQLLPWVARREVAPFSRGRRGGR